MGLGEIRLGEMGLGEMGLGEMGQNRIPERTTCRPRLYFQEHGANVNHSPTA